MTEELLQRKFQLQREVLASWDRLHAAQQAHQRLLNHLHAVRFELERKPELDAFFNELFAEMS